VKQRFQWDVRPCPNAQNVVQGKTCRITVLESRLIRLEYSQNGFFEDRASQMAFYRDFPACKFRSAYTNGILQLQTKDLRIRCQDGLPFSPETLSIQLLQEPGSCWHYGDEIDDLGGTARTLDGTCGPCPLDRGVCSRWGFSVLDDSDSLLLNEDGWIGVRQEDTQDLYFFGFGYDYLAAVKALFRLTGIPPLLPAYALGNWWSRYYAYSQQEYLDLMDRFREEDLPFSVGVVDMDWHITKIPEELKDPNPKFSTGWTGYSWNRELFPDYKAFLKALKDRNLKTALNLHPAQGTCCHEDMYPEMARANGIDPETRQRVPLDLLSPEHMCSYFDILHHPYEEAGVDFWWMDWQQGTNYWWIHEPNQPGQYLDPRERMDPLWMLNHLHILDIARNGKRPMFFSRYAGPGSQRYPVGFSGDTAISWDTLEFQPYFTATASNIGYCWWSHDIGGHMLGHRDDEMFVRWLQLGVFSPINRLHSNNDPFNGKEAWNFGPHSRQIIGEWLRLRHQLFPYLYAMNYRCHEELEPIVQPMYYHYPKKDAAYHVPNQYFFDSELMVLPITQKSCSGDTLTEAQLWLPPGNWFDFFNGLHYASDNGRNMTVCRGLDTIPVFAKAGAIVPLAVHTAHDNRLDGNDSMELLVFPGADGHFTLTEDAGDTLAYQDGCIARTQICLQWGKEAVLVINSALGDLTQVPEIRHWRIGLRGFHRDVAVSLRIDGQAVSCPVQYEAQTNTTWVSISAPVTKQLQITVTGEALIHDNVDVLNRCENLIRNAQTDFRTKAALWELVKQTNMSRNWKNFQLNGNFPEQHSLIKALQELLSLTVSPFVDSTFLGKSQLRNMRKE